jgi:adenylyltransferase/sulfurtransferase
MNNWKEYFKREIQLWGEETQESLLKKRVLIVGAGGLGCSLGVALGGSGVGFIDIVDFDEVAFHNIHRQIAFDKDDVGSPKASCLAQKLSKRNPFLRVKSFEMGFEEFIQNYTKSSSYDLILDATDNLQIRTKIDQWAKSKKIPWIYGSVEGFLGQVCFFEDASFESFANKNHTPDGIAPPMVMQIASFQANLALRYLAKLPIQKDRLFFIYYNNRGEQILQQFKMP